MKVLNWNTEWAVPGSKRGDRVASVIEQAAARLICLTEAYPAMMPHEDFTIAATDDTGYPLPNGRRKVLLWSREPWSEIWQAEDTELPGGRFVTGITEGLRVVGVCIPWRMAHVHTGRKNRAPWEDHLSYLEHLAPILTRFLARPEPLVIVGDWNQRIPKTRWQPREVFEALMKSLPEGVEVVTAGKQLIDHLAVGPGLLPDDFDYFGPRDAEGQRLSDHVGYSCRLQIQPGCQ